MSTDRTSTDQIGSMESLQPADTEQKPTNSDASKDQSISNKDEKVIAPPSVSVNSAGPNRPVQIQVSTPVGSGADRSFPYTPSVYSPQPQTFFYGGYENASGDWEEYSHYVNFDGLDVGSAMVYNEDPSMMFHAGYGYNPQIPYGPYSPAATPLPTVTGDGQFYSPQHFPFSGPGPYYQQQPSPYSPGPNQVISQIDPNPIVPVDPTGQGSLLSSDMLFGRDWSKQPDGSSMTMLPSPVASPQPIPMHNSFGQTSIPGMVTQTHQKPYYGFGFSNNSYDRSYTPNMPYHNFGNYTNYGSPVANSTNSNRGSGFFSMDKNRRRGGPGGPKGNALICSCNGSPLDFLTEQNRGPRATRPKKQESNSDEKGNNNNNNNSSSKEKVVGILKGLNGETYNSPEFLTEYKDAKFYIIKSYSEDNVHKSIKYGVWASTVNGNKKLDAAYHEAKEKAEPCPVFLFFSVNASSQFCGVAEMVGPVDFEKSVSYWQQDKWTGQFPVKWHFVKDVPNNLFRHIILENNDNKPVTNSRDTQEVKLEQGIEMLTIFKNHEADTHLLEDFEYYEKREKLMQENRAHQLQHHLPSQQQLQIQKPGSIVDPSGIKPTSVPDSDFIGQISKTFARAVRVEENKSAELDVSKDNSSSAVLSKAEDLTESK
ncbi:evolutionarily conserved C-terminal region 5 [Rhynchospora pubera]|uniref:YTH domain-containing family protein n=1 Tax=Rhynchospora pubera TaxID=906938 RepID=A0AAV8DZG1_9POAL|nr:evolutionarily conserved C-terminal region 5 [Rhynchospora pubera]